MKLIAIGLLCVAGFGAWLWMPPSEGRPGPVPTPSPGPTPERSLEEPSPVPLPELGAVTTAKFEELPLIEPVAAGPTRTSTVRVLDSAGAPVVNTEVIALARRGWLVTQDVGARGTTDGEGRVTLAVPEVSGNAGWVAWVRSPRWYQRGPTELEPEKIPGRDATVVVEEAAIANLKVVGFQPQYGFWSPPKVRLDGLTAPVFLPESTERGSGPEFVRQWDSTSPPIGGLRPGPARWTVLFHGVEPLHVETVRLSPGKQTVEADLRPTLVWGSLTVLGRDGQPIPGAEVKMLSTDGRSFVTNGNTGEDGRISVPFVRGSAGLVVSASGKSSASVVGLGSGSATLVLEDAIRAEFRVTGIALASSDQEIAIHVTRLSYPEFPLLDHPEGAGAFNGGVGEVLSGVLTGPGRYNAVIEVRKAGNVFG